MEYKYSKMTTGYPYNAIQNIAKLLSVSPAEKLQIKEVYTSAIKEG